MSSGLELRKSKTSPEFNLSPFGKPLEQQQQSGVCSSWGAVSERESKWFEYSSSRVKSFPGMQRLWLQMNIN